jgi:hypothetical protein
MPVLQVKAYIEFSPTCTVIYSLQRNAQDYFVDEVAQLSDRLKQQDIHLIDLNNWFDQAPYLRVSGRERSILREQYQLPANINQAIVVDPSGKEVSRYTGSVTLVSALLACPN